MSDTNSGGGTVDAGDLKSPGFGHEGSTPSPSTIDRYRELYDRIPAFDCIKGCTDCCGPVPFGFSEWQKVKNPVAATGIDCPYIEDGKCSIYEVRPFMCRIFGTVENLRCPRGCGPEKLLTKEEGRFMTTFYKTEIRRDK